MRVRWALLCASVLAAPICAAEPPASARARGRPASQDCHSFANPEQVRVRHLDLTLDVHFESKRLDGEAVLVLERSAADNSQPLILDTHSLDIKNVEVSDDGKAYQKTTFELSQVDKILGAPLKIPLGIGTSFVRIRYATRPEASALQWLDARQTAGRKHPFLFTQSEAIDARSWIPCQDSPRVKMTYAAKVRVPRELMAVMSATNNPVRLQSGEYHFVMTQPIPSYLIALAVGDLAFARLGPRTGVYAEPSVVQRAAFEFADMEAMVQATEKLYGPYRWQRYDVLVLPPSFPYGGMENPRLTFATPTVLAGDKSLVSLVAHELAHSWSGNLVTNATWSDFWLNESFTVYLERRILEQVYGKERAAMEAVIGRGELEEDLKTLPPGDQILHIDLKGRNPDDVSSSIAYEKGYLFLVQLEGVFGRERLDKFLKDYFEHFGFQSITTETFRAYLTKNLLAEDPEKAQHIPVDEWLNKPGLPASAPRCQSAALTAVARHAQEWAKGGTKTAALPFERWCTQERLHFLRSLPEQLSVRQMTDLDDAFALTRSGNAEILCQWLQMAVHNGYEAAYPRLEEFLTSVGRRKFLEPLYSELMKTPPGKELAKRIYDRARPGYHSLAVRAVDDIVQGKK